MNRRLFLTALPFKLCNDAATFVGPTFLSLLLGLVATGGSATRGYSLACLMLLGLLAGTLADNQHFQRVMRAGEAWRLRLRDPREAPGTQRCQARWMQRSWEDSIWGEEQIYSALRV